MDANKFRNILTGDESWFMLKCQHAVKWSLSREDVSGRVRQQIGTKTLMLTVIWGVDSFHVIDLMIKEIKEVIELPIKHPELFENVGIAEAKGILLYGPPGTGKTLLARAVAHHTDTKFIRVSGSELVQKYIGQGARLVREIFVMARQHAPCIIFMDEIDSIGRKRGSGRRGDSEV
jgi:SpoVK/Ycf46/Vps4 family AAA+-type ATPase